MTWFSKNKKKVIVPVDFSDESFAAVDVGLQLVDTPEDLKLIRRVFAALHRPERVFTLDEILDVLDRHPESLRLNAHVEQAKGRPIELKAAYR